MTDEESCALSARIAIRVTIQTADGRQHRALLRHRGSRLILEVDPGVVNQVRDDPAWKAQVCELAARGRILEVQPLPA